MIEMTAKDFGEYLDRIESLQNEFEIIYRNPIRRYLQFYKLKDLYNKAHNLLMLIWTNQIEIIEG